MPDPNKRKGGALSGKEKEVLKWIKHGRSNSDIASLLVISERTVKCHIMNILQKLNAENRTYAVAIAMEKGVLSSKTIRGSVKSSMKNPLDI